MAYIIAENIGLGYDTHIVTDKINFKVNRGDYLCIVGENGAGKSTLMKTILGLIKPITGTIVYGEGIKKNKIGYLPQQTIVQRDFPASVWEIVLSGNLSKCGRWPFYKKCHKQAAKQSMEYMGIYELAHKSYRYLSGGQQQRVLLARALCATTQLLLLDEPMSGLDPKATAELYRLIERLNSEGITIIMITHDIAAAMNNSSHILHIGKQQLFFGRTETYKKSSACKAFKVRETCI